MNQRPRSLKVEKAMVGFLQYKCAEGLAASINNLVFALIRQVKLYNAAQARRWFAAKLSRSFTLLTTPSLLL